MILVIILFGISLVLFFYFNQKRVARINENRRKKREHLFRLLNVLRKKTANTTKGVKDDKKNNISGEDKKI